MSFEDYEKKCNIHHSPKISNYFTEKEVMYSVTALVKKIDNTPSVIMMGAAKDAALNCFDKIRDLIGVMVINCWYRCTALNKEVGGSSTSDHPKAIAIDVNMNSEEEARRKYKLILSKVISRELVVDQLILERKTSIVTGKPVVKWWLHIGYRGARSRSQCFENLK